MKVKRMTRALILVSLMTLIGVIAIAQASSVEPTLIEGNPTCKDLGYPFEYKIEDPYSGTFTFDGFNTVTINTDGTYFDWSSTLGMDAVMSKGGDAANVYFYDPESFGDEGLHSPNNSSGGPAAISHISFCYDYELEISKTAVPKFTRTYHWDIVKSVTPESIEMFVGDQADAKYTIDITKTGYTDSDWNLSGVVTVTNPSPFAVDFSYEDYLSNGMPVDLSCPAMVVPAFGSIDCTYSIDLDSGDYITNTVAITSLTYGVYGGQASASASFTTPTTEVYPTVNVSDTNGDSWEFSDTGSVSYQRTFYCGADEGENGNVATIVETGQSDDANVTVTCNELQVSKTAQTSLTRTWQWDIDKSVSPDTWNLFKGDDATSTWTVSVDKLDTVDSDWAVTGSIFVYNPANIAAEITDVSDWVSDIGPAVVDCGVSFPYILGAGQTLACSYSLGLPNGQDRTNQATAVLQNYAYAPDGQGTKLGETNFYSPLVAVSFADPIITIVNDTIHVTDTNGKSWDFSDDASVSYDETFFCDGDAGNHHNVATITETGQSADADLDVACYDLTVTKTADTFFNRYWTWNIDKSADQTELLLSAGQLFQVNYDVTVNAAFKDADFKVSGDIVISNPAPMNAPLTDVKDLMDGADVTVNCPAMIVPAQGTLTCTYTQAVSDDSTRTNIATATLQNHSYDPLKAATMSGTTDFVSDPVKVSFANATMDQEFDECVDLSDTLYGFMGTVCANETTKTFHFSYSLWFGKNPDADVLLECGYNETPNVASFITNDNGYTGEDDWIVYTDVACDFGCTLTPGYWKTHSRFGPAPYDDTWALLEDAAEYTIFFKSNQTYYDVLWTNPKGGNAYYILAHAYIAAELNVLNGASMPDDVLEAFNAATGIFEKYTPDDIASMKGKTGKNIRAYIIDLATILDDYNNGYYGPGHCTE